MKTDVRQTALEQIDKLIKHIDAKGDPALVSSGLAKVRLAILMLNDKISALEKYRDEIQKAHYEDRTKHRQSVTVLRDSLERTEKELQNTKKTAPKGPGVLVKPVVPSSRGRRRQA